MKGRETFYLTCLGLVVLSLALRKRGSPLFRTTSRRRETDVTLGTARQGIRRFRLVDVPVSDFTMTLAGAAFLARVSRGSLVPWLILLLVVSEAQHFFFGIPTSTQVWFFGEEGN